MPKVPHCVAWVYFALAWTTPAMAAKIACVGDSITYGYGLADPSSQSYPARLQRALGLAHTVRNFGVGGTTLLKSTETPYWETPQFGASSSFAPDIVVVMLGTNDAKPQNWVGKANFASDHRELVEHYRGLGARVYVATPPPAYAPGAFGVAPPVVADEVAPLVRRSAQELGAPLIDVFDALGGKPEMFPDRVHPNADGAELIAVTVAASLAADGLEAAGTWDDPAIPASDAGGCAVHSTRRARVRLEWLVALALLGWLTRCRPRRGCNGSADRGAARRSVSVGVLPPPTN